MTRGTAIVTGAARPEGLGYASARLLSRTHAGIALVDVNQEAIAETAARLQAETDVPVVGIAADLTSPEQVDSAFSHIEANLPPVHSVVNNAGITSPTKFADITVDEWDRLFAVNVRSMFLVTQRTLPSLTAAGNGRVVCMSSAAAQRGGGTFGTVHYSSTKAAVLGFVRCLARELGPTGVTVNAVAPGVIGTGITAGADSNRAQILASIPTLRDGRAEEVGAVVAFLCDDASSYVTGSCYDVNGGFHIH
jgi:NAD(P)-dependent dehydrogenase (short-subunit alcohol dehydrogenase family)